ncbi:9608_t:CDS:2, partial [Entrophospora sp. SA101]
MDPSNINIYEYESFVDEYEHEEFENSEVTNVNENTDTFVSTNIIEISDDISEENIEESTNSR